MRRNPLRHLPLALSIAFLSACGGGGDGGAGGGSVLEGAVTLAITDAPSDLIDLFEVDVLSLRLERLDGAVVEALPNTTRVDFADLVALSDLLTTVTVPAGTYRRLELTLDPSSAAVHLDGQNAMAALLDADGNAFVGPVTVGVDLPGDRPLVVTPGVARFVEFDFDLDASAVADAGANTVRLGPVLYAQAEPSAPKPVRAYGRLVATDAATPSFTFERLARREMARGREHEALVSAATRYEVDGATGTGAAGFALLAAKPAGTRLEIRGVFDPARRKLLATDVQAGRGVFDGTRDLVEGVVLARSGAAGADARLTVRGLGLDRGHRALFDRTFTVSASFSNTRVLKFGDGSRHDLDDVDVGQRIVAVGTLAASTLDATSPTDGFVRLLDTGISGLASGAASAGVLTLDLRRIEARPVAAFDFSVGGSPLAVPTAFQIGIGTMTLPGIAAGSAVQARGFFAPVDAPGTATDFEAVSVVDRTATASFLAVRWVPPASAPFTAAAATGVTLDLSAATAARLDLGGIALVDLLGGSNPQVVPAPTGGPFAIRQAGAITLHADFGAWLSDLQARLADASVPAGTAEIVGLGRWEPASSKLTALRLVAVLR